MKVLLLVVLLGLLLVLQNGGIAADTVPTDGDARNCTTAPEGDEKFRHTLLVDRAMGCVVSDERLIRANHFDTLEGFRAFFGDFCSQGGEIGECLNQVLEEAGVCVNRTNQLVLTILREMLKTVVNVGCVNDGEPFAQVIFGFKVNGFGHTVKRCTDMLGAIVPDTTPEGAMRMMVRFHRKLNDIKVCLVHAMGSGYHDLKTYVRDMFDEVRKELLCIQPDDRNLVLCSSLQVERE